MADPCHPSTWEPETRASTGELELGYAVILTQPPLRTKTRFQTSTILVQILNLGIYYYKQNPTY